MRYQGRPQTRSPFFVASVRYALAAGCAICAACGASGAAEVVLVRVDKSERMLELVSDDGSVTRYDVALGADPHGHKQREGDGRTPEGKYVLDWRNARSAYYKSIHISYPDAADRAEAAVRGETPGGMIMIHGQKNGFGFLGPIVQLFDWTEGCIAVANDDMDEIWKQVKNGTPIEIMP